VTVTKLERACPTDLPSAPPVLVRPLRRDALQEVNYVRSSWSRDAMAQRPAKVWMDARGKVTRIDRMDERLFFEGHVRRLVPRLLRRSLIYVAVPKETPNLVAGWIAYEEAYRVVEPGFAKPEAHRPCVVHYVYVTRDMRGSGVASTLLRVLPKEDVVYSHWSPAMEWIAGKRGWSYDETRKWD